MARSRAALPLIVGLAFLIGCSAFPIKSNALPGTYVMNRGRAADTLVLQSDGRYSRVYAMPDQQPAVDTGSWSLQTFHGDVVVSLTNFRLWWRDEIDPPGRRHAPGSRAEVWLAPPHRSMSGRIHLIVDEDLDWSYARRR